MQSVDTFPAEHSICISNQCWFFLLIFFTSITEGFSMAQKSLSKYNSKPYFRIYTFLCYFFIATADANGSMQINKYTERVNLQIHCTATFAPLLCVCRAAFHPTSYSLDSTYRVVKSAVPYYTVCVLACDRNQEEVKLFRPGPGCIEYTVFVYFRTFGLSLSDAYIFFTLLLRLFHIQSKIDIKIYKHCMLVDAVAAKGKLSLECTERVRTSRGHATHIKPTYKHLESGCHVILTHFGLTPHFCTSHFPIFSRLARKWYHLTLQRIC